MKAIILAAGMGTRIRAVTKSIPKCLIQVGGKTILEQQITALQENGINDIIIITGYKQKQIKPLIKKYALKMYTNRWYRTTGMLESLWCAREELQGDVLFLYGDVYLKAQVIRRLLAQKGDMVLVVGSLARHEKEQVFESYHGLT